MAPLPSAYAYLTFKVYVINVNFRKTGTKQHADDKLTVPNWATLKPRFLLFICEQLMQISNTVEGIFVWIDGQPIRRTLHY